jgi:hypothetical protein
MAGWTSKGARPLPDPCQPALWRKQTRPPANAAGSSPRGRGPPPPDLLAREGPEEAGRQHQENSKQRVTLDGDLLSGRVCGLEHRHPGSKRGEATLARQVRKATPAPPAS